MVAEKSCVIVVPVYKPVLTEYEMFSLRRMVEVFHHYPIALLMPEWMDENIFTEKFAKVIVVKIEAKHFKGVASYNKLMLSTIFYDLWIKRGYENVLICQLDVFVIKDELRKFLSMPYDYFGAPLVRLNHTNAPMLYGGNGGFSLRNLKACRQLLLKHALEVEDWYENEDEFFSFCGEQYPDEFEAAPPYISAMFAYDRFSRFLYAWQEGELPFALHGWYSYDIDFSRELLVKMGIKAVPSLSMISCAERLRELDTFLAGAESIFLYGAGIWGKAFAHYFLSKGVSVLGILVSDHIAIKEQNIFGIPVLHVCALLDDVADVSVVISMSERAMKDGEYMAIQDGLIKKGIRNIFLSDVRLYNYVMEYWLFCVHK